ncbi:MAG: hypothetical protein DRJ32_03170 [Thermoprotei archaeon]|nr:MAG: hypothetical protein DRJ32_03170 [Thermoprotei archaeon]
MLMLLVVLSVQAQPSNNTGGGFNFPIPINVGYLANLIISGLKVTGAVVSGVCIAYLIGKGLYRIYKYGTVSGPMAAGEESRVREIFEKVVWFFVAVGLVLWIPTLLEAAGIKGFGWLALTWDDIATVMNSIFGGGG